MAQIVYALCGLTSLVCAWLLLRQHRRTRGSLLFWSTLCFVCFGLTNVLLFIDFVILPQVDLSLLRNAVTLAGMLMLLYGLIREST